MDSHKLALKLFVKNPPRLAGDEFVPVFHKWIQDKQFADHLVIDVADYQHVPNGPGTLLITLEANLTTDKEDGRLGLLYVRKLEIPGTTTFRERLAAIARPVLHAAQLLEDEPAFAGRITFATDEWLFRVYDRLLAPNSESTFADVKSDLSAFFAELYGQPPTALEFKPSSQTLFEVRVRTSRSPSLSELLHNLEPALSPI